MFRNYVDSILTLVVPTLHTRICTHMQVFVPPNLARLLHTRWRGKWHLQVVHRAMKVEAARMQTLGLPWMYVVLISL